MAENIEINYRKLSHVDRDETKFNRKGFISLVLMAFILNYVESMVIPSIPVLQVSFGSSTSISSWLISAFLISGTVAAPLFGKLGDKYGKKRMLMVTFTIYSSGLAIAGFAPSMGVLILSRALQGVGFGGIPLGFAMMIDMFPREKLSGAQGIMSGMFATGGVAGLVAGSYIMAAVGWQWAFHSALIISVGLMAGLFVFLRDNGNTVDEKIDFRGAFSLTLGLTLVLLYITEGSMSGWLTLDNIIMLVSGLSILSVFLWNEGRSAEPLLQLKLLKDRNIKVANLIGTLSMAIMQIMFLAIVYYADDPSPFGDGFNSIRTGLVLAPGALAMAFYGPLLGRIIRKIGPKPIMAVGGGLLATGMTVFLFLRGDMAWLILAGVMMWMGMVSMLVPSTNMIALGLPPERRSIGMGMNMMLRNLGGALGPAVAATLMTLYSDPIPAASTGSGQVAFLPMPMAFNLLMGVGIVLVSVLLLLNVWTRNYTFGNKNTPQTDG